MSDQPACAHRRVVYHEIVTRADWGQTDERWQRFHVPPDVIEGWWECDAGCSTRFAPVRAAEVARVTVPAGGPSQLDLTALEARLRVFEPDKWGPGAAGIAFDALALLALLRETRAALRPFAALAATVLTNMDDDLNLDQQIPAGDLRRAAAVLAQAVD